MLLTTTLLLLTSAHASPDFPAPKLHENSLELKNTATVESYNRKHKQPDWMFYPLGKEQLQDCYDRSSAFRPDDRLERGDAAQLADYKGSGYDRGHNAPAGDNKWNEDAMSESFLLSNISPQPPAFNRGIWARLEGLVRAWAKDKGSIFVTTGPLLKDGLDTIGDDEVSVPEYFYKVLFNPEQNDAIAFLLPNDAKGDFGQFEMPVSKLEDLTGLDFLDGIKNETEVKTHMDASAWDLKAKFSYFPCQAVKPKKNEPFWGLSLR